MISTFELEVIKLDTYELSQLLSPMILELGFGARVQKPETPPPLSPGWLAVVGNEETEGNLKTTIHLKP